jgi:hypothetical protein
MALGFLVCIAPDSHISYLQQHQGFIHFYLDGITPPDSELSSPLPVWWPNQAPQMLDSWSVNYRNTDLYHWILNGKPDLVAGAGSIFQTWYEPGYSASFVKLDNHNERFAFYSEQISELAALVTNVNVKSVFTAFTDWCKSQGKSHENIDESACEPFVDEFKALGDLLNEAMQKKYGLIW